MVFSHRDHLGQADLAVAYLDRMADRLAPVKARLMELLSPVPGSCVLDLGCGAGHDLVALADRQVTPIGVDFSEHMVRASRDRCDSVGVVALVVRADGHRLPLRSATIDGCRIERVLQHVDQPLAVLRDVFRVLRPGGRLVAFEPDWDSFAIESDDRAFGALISQTIASHFRQPHMGSDFRSLLDRADFRSIECISDPVELSSFDALRQRVGIEAILERACKKRLLDANAVEGWMSEMHARSTRDTFRSTLDRTFATACRR
jgi:SAM-dependent methyltransferase